MITKLGQMKRVTNSQRKFGSVSYYNAVWIKEGSYYHPLLFTETELNDAKQRAIQNREDLPKLKKTFIERLKLALKFIKC